MPATAAATIAAAQMIFSLEDNQAPAIKIKIARQQRGGFAIPPALPKPVHAILTNAGPVSQFRRDAGQQFVRDLHTHAPARSFVRALAAQLAAVRPAAQW